MKRFVIDLSTSWKCSWGSGSGAGTDAVIAATAAEAVLVAALEEVLDQRAREESAQRLEYDSIDYKHKVGAQLVSHPEIAEAFAEAHDNNEGAARVVHLDVARNGDQILLSLKLVREQVQDTLAVLASSAR